MRRLSGGLFAAVAVLVGMVVAVPPAVRSSAPPITVLVHGAGGSIAAAVGALEAHDLPLIHPMGAIGVAVTNGQPAVLRQLSTDSRVERVEPAPPPMKFLLDTSRRSIRLDDAATITTTGPKGTPVPFDGTGISIAIIDMGIDATHPMFQLPDGTSSVVRNLEMACVDRLPTGELPTCNRAGLENDQLFVDAPPTNDTDGPAGGHGTHVASTAAGQRVTTADGRTLQGVAPGARLVGLGTTSEAGYTWAGIAALNWVVEHHKAPCGAGVPATVCPPIKVVNNSWRYYGEPYDPESALNRAAKAVVDAGITIAWAAGNEGETPDKATTHGAVHAPVEGIISVASYNDGDHGGRDGYLSAFSSRGLQGEYRTYPDISAPGDHISAACRPYMTVCSGGADTRDPNYNTISGTSMAAPHVAGAAAVLLQANPALRPAEVERIVEASAYKFRSRGKYEPDPAHPGTTTSYDKGHGLLDVAAAVAMATGRPTPPVRTYPDAYKPPAPSGDAAIGQDFDWTGGPLIGPSPSCGTGPTGLDCERTGIRLKVPDGGADVTVTVNPVGTEIGFQLIGPDGSVAAEHNYTCCTIGETKIDATVFADGVYTVAVWSVWGATATYDANLSLTEVVEY
ncbi:MAG TPA: S8 family serine peptidase [Acidimicrobiales bacterium]|nr:S8 family serine peptidase [Acidimicrobiales bacterium]